MQREGVGTSTSTVRTDERCSPTHKYTHARTHSRNTHTSFSFGRRRWTPRALASVGLPVPAVRVIPSVTRFSTAFCRHVVRFVIRFVRDTVTAWLASVPSHGGFLSRSCSPVRSCDGGSTGSTPRADSSLRFVTRAVAVTSATDSQLRYSVRR